MYILPMIAVAGLWRKICKDDNILVIERLGYLLCTPHGMLRIRFCLASYCPPAADHKHQLSADCGELTRSLIVPQMVFIAQISTQISESFMITFPPDADGNMESVQFSDFVRMSTKLREFDTG